MEKPLVDLERRSLPAQLATRIHASIIDGTYPPGAQLPHQKQLAELYAVSPAVIREALALLSAGGIIWSRAGRGTFVADLHDAILRYPTWIGTPSSGDELAEATEARDVLERAIVRLAARRRREEDIQRLEPCLDAMEEASDGEGFAEADLALHLTLAEIAGNRALYSALASLRHLIRDDIVSRANREFATGEIKRARADHHRVIEAVKRGDEEQAEAIMTEILERALKDHPAAGRGQDTPNKTQDTP